MAELEGQDRRCFFEPRVLGVESTNNSMDYTIHSSVKHISSSVSSLFGLWQCRRTSARFAECEFCSLSPPNAIFFQLLPLSHASLVVRSTGVVCLAADAAVSFRGTPAQGATAPTAPWIATSGITSGARRNFTGALVAIPLMNPFPGYEFEYAAGGRCGTQAWRGSATCWVRELKKKRLLQITKIRGTKP